MPTPLKYYVHLFPLRSRVEPPPPPEQVLPLIECKTRKFDVDQRGQVTERQAGEFQLGFDPERDVDGDGLVIPTGLFFSLVSRLREGGSIVKINDHRVYDDRLTGDNEVLKAAMLDDNVILNAVRQHPMGQIEVNGPDGAAEAISLILEYFPNARALVPVASRNLADSLSWKLTQHGVPVSRQFTARRLKSTRCAIVTYKKLYGARRGEWDLLLLTDPEGATNIQSPHAIEHAMAKGASGWEDGLEYHDRGMRVYSLVEPNWTRAKNRKLRLEVVSGPTIVKMISRRAGVECLWLRTPSRTKINTTNGVDFKRETYWHHQRRNQYAASVARAFRECDRRKLQRYGINLSGDVPEIRGGQAPNVAVLVESSEHAEELAGHLPDWAVRRWTGKPQGRRQKRPLRNGIITVSAAQAYGLKLDVLVVASGEPAALDALGFPPPLNGQDDREVLVVDFTDEFDPKSRKRSADRRRDAGRRGWEDITPTTQANQRTKGNR